MEYQKMHFLLEKKLNTHLLYIGFFRNFFYILPVGVKVPNFMRIFFSIKRSLFAQTLWLFSWSCKRTFFLNPSKNNISFKLWEVKSSFLQTFLNAAVSRFYQSIEGLHCYVFLIVRIPTRFSDKFFFTCVTKRALNVGSTNDNNRDNLCKLRKKK